MRRHATILLALLILTAGCADFLPWSQSPSPPSTTDNAVDYPPGANAEWIVASEHLLAAHQTTLNHTPYRLNASIRPNHSATGPKWGNSTLTAHHGGDQMVIEETGDLIALNNSYPYRGYQSNHTAIHRANKPTGEKYFYRVSRGKSHLQANRQTVTEQIRTILASGDFLSNGTHKQNGTTLYRYNTTGTSSQAGLQSVQATVLVDQQGMIHALKGVLQTSGSRSIRVRFSYSFARVAEPPTQPTWTNRVPHLRVSTTETGALRIDHTGGRVISAGTEMMFVTQNNSSVISGQTNLTTRLTSGDTAYLTITNTTGDDRRLRGDGTLTVNQPPQQSAGAVQIAPGSGWVGIGTDQWSAEVMNIPPKRTTNSSNLILHQM